MNLYHDRRGHDVYRDVLGWPMPPRPETPSGIVADLRALLAERRRRRELRHANLRSRP